MKISAIKVSVLILCTMLLQGCPYPDLGGNSRVGLVSKYCSTNMLSVGESKSPNLIKINIDQENKYYTNVETEGGSRLLKDILNRNKDTFTYDLNSLSLVEFHLMDKRIALGNKLQNISITSDTDWSADYPAGSSLNNLFYFLSSSPDKYLSNKSIVNDPFDLEEYYKNNLEVFNEDLKRYLDPQSVFIPIFGKVSDINFPQFNITLLEDKTVQSGPVDRIFCLLIPAERPANPITIKVRFSFDAGDDTVLEIDMI